MSWDHDFHRALGLLVDDPRDGLGVVIDVAAQALARLMTVPHLDDDLNVTGAAMHLSMARDELRRVGEEPPSFTLDAAGPSDSDASGVVESLLGLLGVARRAAGIEARTAGDSATVLLARTRVAMLLDAAYLELQVLVA